MNIQTASYSNLVEFHNSMCKKGRELSATAKEGWNSLTASQIININVTISEAARTIKRVKDEITRRSNLN